MKIEIDLDTLGNTWHLFNTKEEYDNHIHSRTGWEKTWKEGMYLERYRNEPSRNAKFPILVIEAGWWSNPDGPDEIENIIFDSNQFTIVKD